MARKRHRGHYCWACDRIRANERFSGRGHARHLCKECARQGKEELAYRQAIRDLERLLDLNGHVRRKRREQSQKYLAHENERARANPCKIEFAGAVYRMKLRIAYDLFLELAIEGICPLKVITDADDFVGNTENQEEPYVSIDEEWM